MPFTLLFPLLNRILARFVRLPVYLLKKAYIDSQTVTAGSWGGEEFLVPLPGSNAGQAATVAERLRQRIAEGRFEYVECCTASIGVAQYRPHETPEELISRVDEALYQAKDNRAQSCGTCRE